MIKNVQVKVEDLLDEKRVGHVLTVSFDSTDRENLDFRWYEKADKQYESSGRVERGSFTLTLSQNRA